MSTATHEPEAPSPAQEKVRLKLYPSTGLDPAVESAQLSMRTLGVRRIVEAAIAVLVLAGVAWFVVLQNESRTLHRRLQVAADSLVLARQYNALITEVLDLETELHARQVGQIGPDVGLVKLPTGNQLGPVVLVRPIPAFSVEHINPAEQQRAQAALAQSRASHASPQSVIVFQQSDVIGTGAAARLRDLGFQVEGRREARKGPSTAVTIGSNVSATDARLVGLALMAGGIDVKRIRRSADPTLRSTITISYVARVLDWPGLRVVDLDHIAL